MNYYEKDCFIQALGMVWGGARGFTSFYHSVVVDMKKGPKSKQFRSILFTMVNRITRDVLLAIIAG